ncbi:starch synthase [Rhizobiales bacterium GAS191]|nr:starch synthase [Rhizobiales bacterium GAS191]
MRVLSVTPEIYPLVKTGGLADVAGALPRALAREGIAVRSLIPGYPAVLGALTSVKTVHSFGELFGGPAQLLDASAADLALFVLDAPHLYGRDGNPYLDAAGQDWPDNAFRFGALGRVAADIGQGLLPAFAPDIIHAHDWQAGLTPAYLQVGPGRRPGTVMTVHNLAFQGLFAPEVLGRLGLPAEMMTMEGVEYYGQIGFLKAGLCFADAITTVSPSYAAEICTPENGMGLDGLLQSRASILTGICNGIDTEVWNPRTDAHLAAPFDAESLEAKRINTTALRERFGLAHLADAPLFGLISRLTSQKGIDLAIAAIPDLVARGAQLALLGSGDSKLEAGLAQAASQNPGSVAVAFGYDEPLAHLMQAGCDALIVPSRFEPCGLTQLAALRYGTLPVVSRVGGLADTVIDANEAAIAAGVATGFQFGPPTTDTLLQALHRALTLWQTKGAWQRLQRNAMSSDVGWDRSARLYASLFKSVARNPVFAAHP